MNFLACDIDFSLSLNLIEILYSGKALSMRAHYEVHVVNARCMHVVYMVKTHGFPLVFFIFLLFFFQSDLNS